MEEPTTDKPAEQPTWDGDANTILVLTIAGVACFLTAPIALALGWRRIRSDRRSGTPTRTLVKWSTAASAVMSVLLVCSVGAIAVDSARRAADPAYAAQAAAEESARAASNAAAEREAAAQASQQAFQEAAQARADELKAERNKDRSGEAWQQCKAKMGEMLLAPASAGWPMPGWEFGIAQNANAYSTRAWVDTDNVYGAKVRIEFSCHAVYHDDGTWDTTVTPDL